MYVFHLPFFRVYFCSSLSWLSLTNVSLMLEMTFVDSAENMKVLRRAVWPFVYLSGPTIFSPDMDKLIHTHIQTQTHIYRERMCQVELKTA